MEKENASILLQNYLEKITMKSVCDENLKHCKSYFIDSSGEKYIFYCIFFDSVEELLNSWEEKQDDDIALYLQSVKYANSDIRWDMYYLLLYNGSETLSDDYYIKIERNRFCSRKILINTTDEATFIGDLSKKLPLTNPDYYPDSDLCLISNNEFFNELRKVAGLDINVFTDDIFENILNYSEKWVQLLNLKV